MGVITIKQLKVRPRKAPPQVMCAAELGTMLSCWAATSDMMSVGPCKETADALFHCMRTTPMGGKGHRSTINYHLAKLSKSQSNK
ncbi:hypothetical protein PUNSTDRAFT_53145 [Punctularia strigosozonata HHB-11173 SS5]|uniref:uncharacterized protein n=1 Tax=Punctularia strigosozonata (strain HHB-11173) TaxID=741275 RepID=UPI00044170DA|nr:uncharacterized protein PUNSTDRAFT_53145 [Punctularia strigosozonata HHB-11173 SS5]EIN07787.1 hypothetical protein PUNSTDRAFT_53145 [Punctularia strigosozonata HHB-11173 SS5]